MATEELYLGDGLYASYDGYQIKLRAPRSEGDHEVFLDPHVVPTFLLFLCKAFGKSTIISAIEELAP